MGPPRVYAEQAVIDSLAALAEKEMETEASKTNKHTRKLCTTAKHMKNLSTTDLGQIVTYMTVKETYDGSRFIFTWYINPHNEITNPDMEDENEVSGTQLHQALLYTMKAKFKNVEIKSGPAPRSTIERVLATKLKQYSKKDGNDDDDQ